MIRVFRVVPPEAFRHAKTRAPDLVASDLAALLEIIEKAGRDAPNDPELRTLGLALNGLGPREAADVMVLRGGGMFQTSRAVARVEDGARSAR